MPLAEASAAENGQQDLTPHPCQHSQGVGQAESSQNLVSRQELLHSRQFLRLLEEWREQTEPAAYLGVTLRQLQALTRCYQTSLVVGWAWVQGVDCWVCVEWLADAAVHDYGLMSSLVLLLGTLQGC